MPSRLCGPGLSHVCPMSVSMSQSFCHLSFDSCIILVNTLHWKDPASKNALGFFTCFHFREFASIFFFPEVFWLLVEMLDSQPVPGDLSSGSWPDSPGGILKMQLNFCSLIRPTSPVWAPALHGLELPKALCSLSPVHPDWLTGRAGQGYFQLSELISLPFDDIFWNSFASQPCFPAFLVVSCLLVYLDVDQGQS